MFLLLEGQKKGRQTRAGYLPARDAQPCGVVAVSTFGSKGSFNISGAYAFCQ